MPTVGFLTSAELNQLNADDRLVLPLLAAHGVRVEPVVWSDEQADVSRFDLCVIRSTWDWYRDARRYFARLEAIDARVPLFNRGAWRWLDKRYLERLGERGARVPPMTVVRSAVELDVALASLPGPKAVLKPATAAAGHRTVRFDVRDCTAAAKALSDILEDDVALLQPYLAEVETDGEWSLLFFDGKYSHAIKKRPRAGEFRVHEEYGGKFEPTSPPPDVIAAAEKSLAASGEDTLYARVDGIVVPSLGGFCTTELELVEPELFFRMDSGAAQRFADAIVKRLR